MITQASIEEIIYDDKYRISIPKLLFSNRINSRKEMQDLLNDNGYYGRAVVFSKREYGHPTNKLYVKIDLIESNYIYKWPFNSYYDTREKKVDFVKPKIKVTPQLRSGMRTIVMAKAQNKLYNINDDSISFDSMLHVYGNMAAATRSLVIKQLMQLRLLNEEKLILKSLDDVDELYYNQFDQTYSI